MAKISAEERQRKKEQLDKIVLDIFWESGWRSISYASIAERFGTTRGAIQRYYPSQIDFGVALRGKVLPLLVSKLDWSSRDAFYQSWVEQLESDDKRFKRVMELLFNQVNVEKPNELSRVGVGKLLKMIEDKFDDAYLGKTLFGETFLSLLNSNSAD